MAPDIDNVTKLLREDKIWQSVRVYIEDYHSQVFEILKKFENFENSKKFKKSKKILKKSQNRAT